MPEFGEMFDKAKDTATEHSEQINEGMDKGREFVDEKTGGKYGDQLQQGQEKVEGFMGGGDDRGQGGGGDDRGQGGGDFGGRESEGGYDQGADGGGYGGDRESEGGYGERGQESGGDSYGRDSEGGDWR